MTTPKRALEKSRESILRSGSSNLKSSKKSVKSHNTGIRSNSTVLGYVNSKIHKQSVERGIPNMDLVYDSIMFNPSNEKKGQT